MKRTVTVFLSIFACISVLPVLFLLIGSFMGNMEIRELLFPILGEAEGFASWKLMPRYPTIRSYVELLLDTPGFFVMFWNSVKITVGVLAGHLLVGVPAAWGFSRYTFPGKKLLFTLYIGLMMMPFQVMMLSNYLVLDRLHLLDSLLGIVLPAVFSTFPVFIMYRFFQGLPEALLESARLDGAGEGAIFSGLEFPLDHRE